MKCCAVAIAAALVASSTAAESLSLDSRVQWRAESNDNIGLVPAPAGSAQRLLLSGGLNAARESESAATRLDADIGLRDGNQGERRVAEGRVALLQTLLWPRDNASVSLSLARDDTVDTRRDAADLPLGDSRRDTRAATASWAHQFSERWSGSTDVNLSRTGYAGPGNADFDNRSLSLGISRRWSETRRFGARLSRSDYRQPAGDIESTSDSLRLTASQVLDERSNLSLGLGAYRTLTTRPLFALVCPLAQAFCDAGVVAWVTVRSDSQSRGSGSQYDLGYDLSFDERTQLKLSAARELSPSGIGVQRADTLSASGSMAFAPLWRGTVAWTESRNRAADAADAPRPLLRTLDLGSSWQWSERLTLLANLTLRRYTEPRGGIRASSNGFSIALQYTAPKLVASR